MSVRQLQFTHELDAAWIMALWKAIHGGDPGPEQIAVQAIAALSRYVGVAEQPFNMDHARKEMERIGAGIKGPEEGVHDAAQGGLQAVRPPRQYCFIFQGKTYCITLPGVHGPLPQ
jgi:hypothetical protein